MEEQILKILNDDTCHCSDCKLETAKKITDHVMEFIEWYVFKGQFEFRFEDLHHSYQYWLTNIKK